MYVLPDIPVAPLTHALLLDISTSYVDSLQSYSSPSSTPPRDPSPDRDEPRSSQGTAPKIANGAAAAAAAAAPHDTDLERQPLLSTGNGHTCKQSHTHTSVHKDCHHHCHEHGHRVDQHAPHSHHQHAPFYGTTHTHPQDHVRTRTTSTISVHHAHRDTAGGNNSNGGAVILEGHHRHEPRTAHSAHHDRGPRLPSLYGEEERGRRVVGCVHDRDGHGHGHHGHHHAHGHVHGLAGGVYGDAEKEVRVGEKRQIIGILVRLFPSSSSSSS